MVVSSDVISAIFREFDTRKCGCLSFRDVCLGLVTACISSWDIRARFLFGVFDSDGDSLLREADVRNLLLCIISAVRNSVAGGDHSVMFPFMVPTDPSPQPPFTGDIFLERIQSCVTAIQSEVVSAVNDDRASFDETSYCDHIPTAEESNWINYEISLLFGNQKDVIDFQTDFLPWSCRNCHYLYKFLELLEIVPSPAREKRICLNILRKSFPASPGSTWCVVSYKWVQLWKAYVHWSETDSQNTMWMSSTIQNTFTPDNQVVIGEIFHAVSTMDAMSCTSTIIQQRMSERPMAINNADLEGELKGALRGNLVEFHDYVLVPEEMWRYLSEWYGGGPAFPRKIIIPRRRACSSLGSSPLGYASYTVDLYPPLISVVLCGENGLPVKHFTKRFFVSKSDSCEDLLDQLVRRIGENAPRPARLWHKQNGERWELVDMSDSRRVEEYVDSVSTEAGTFMLEVARDTGKWPRDTIVQMPIGDVSDELQVGDRVDALVANSPRKWRKATIVDVFDDKAVKVHFDGEQYIHDAWLSCDLDEIAPLGTHTLNEVQVRKINRRLTGTDIAKKQRDEPIGLENIGNTCFMNSSLQCLSHTPMLREYFLTREFEKHMRSSAKMAGEFASLLFNMCTSQKRFIAPKSFKRALDKYAPFFSGYEHQDAHELLAVLLDGLHEDLNRGAAPLTANTTATVTPDGPSTPVAMAPQFVRTTSSGEDEWRKHRYHNTSVIADLFDGQQRVVTECKSCGHQCENFEAFRYLMLPVPVTDTRNIAVDLVVSGTGETIRLIATVHRGALMQAVVTSLASRYSCLTKKYGLDWETGGIVLVEVYMSRIHRFIDLMMPVCDFRSDDRIMAFQVESNKVYNEVALETSPWSYAQIVHRKEVVSKRQRRTVTRKEIFGTPIVLSVNQTWRNEQLHRVIRERLGVQKQCPFVVRVTTPDGACTCTACGGISCEGCVIHPTDSKTLVSCYSGGSSWLYLAVDWQSPSSYKENPETILLPQNPDANQAKFAKSSKSTSLYDCLDSYTASEFLGGDNRWHCEKCKQLSDAVRRTSFWVTPDVLVVLLKRFQFSPTCGFEKISVPVKFPESELVIKSSTYDLYGVVNHFGSLSSGHYTALCREESTSRWFIYNDHQVTLVGTDELEKEFNSCAKSCYVLFYKRRTTRPANIINYYGLNE